MGLAQCRSGCHAPVHAARGERTGPMTRGGTLDLRGTRTKPGICGMSMPGQVSVGTLRTRPTRLSRANTHGMARAYTEWLMHTTLAKSLPVVSKKPRPGTSSSASRLAAPYQGRSSPTNVALVASRVGAYRVAMDESPRNEVPGNGVGRRNVRVIALVDDDEGFRDALQRFLRTLGFDAEAFASGEEFLRRNRMDSVACLILDLAMPKMNGLGVAEQLVARGLQIPIVFVTAHRDEQLGQRAAAGGALAVLRKPVDHDELVRLVREALGR